MSDTNQFALDMLAAEAVLAPAALLVQMEIEMGGGMGGGNMQLPIFVSYPCS